MKHVNFDLRKLRYIVLCLRCYLVIRRKERDSKRAQLHVHSFMQYFSCTDVRTELLPDRKNYLGRGSGRIAMESEKHTIATQIRTPIRNFINIQLFVSDTVNSTNKQVE